MCLLYITPEIFHLAVKVGLNLEGSQTLIPLSTFTIPRKRENSSTLIKLAPNPRAKHTTAPPKNRFCEKRRPPKRNKTGCISNVPCAPFCASITKAIQPKAKRCSATVRRAARQQTTVDGPITKTAQLGCITQEVQLLSTSPS